jgi:two-component system nitrate/nitrite response regulator NarL
MMRIGIICPNELTREGLRGILRESDLVVQSTAATFADLDMGLFDGGAPHILLLTGLQGDSLLKACRDVRETFPLSSVVITMDDPEVPIVAEAFSAGATAVLGKDLSCGQLIAALKLAALGHRLVPDNIIDSLSHELFMPASRNWNGNGAVDLSDREIDILKCLVAGEANKVIARHLRITEATVKVHIKAILRKLKVANRTQAAIWAVLRGMSRLEVVPAGHAGAIANPTQMCA